MNLRERAAPYEGSSSLLGGFSLPGTVSPLWTSRKRVSKCIVVIAPDLGATAPTRTAMVDTLARHEVTNASSLWSSIAKMLESPDDDTRPPQPLEAIGCFLETHDQTRENVAFPRPRVTLPPLEVQADVTLTAEESHQLAELLRHPPRATPGLRRALARRR